MEGLNKCVEELGDCVLDPYKDSITSTDGVQQEVVPDVEGTLESPEMVKFVIPIWMYIITIFCLSITVGVLVLLGCHLRRTRMNRFIHTNASNPKSDNESVRTNTIVFHPDSNENYEVNTKNGNYSRHEEDYMDKDNSSIDSVTSQSLTSCSNANETEYQVNSLTNRRDSPAGIVYCSSNDNISQPISDKSPEFKSQISFDKKVPISSTMLSTDELMDGTSSEQSHQDRSNSNFNFF
ncbi:unnamed protein product [Auanema sp. JU1783]|nr:unnamed protein product [Auanema sp. JU1783]